MSLSEQSITKHKAIAIVVCNPQLQQQHIAKQGYRYLRLRILNEQIMGQIGQSEWICTLLNSESNM